MNNKIFIIILLFFCVIPVFSENEIVYASLNITADMQLRVLNPGLNKFIFDLDSVFSEGVFSDEEYIFSNHKNEDYLIEAKIIQYQPGENINLLAIYYRVNNGIKKVELEKVIKYKWKKQLFKSDKKELIKSDPDNEIIKDAISNINKSYSNLKNNNEEYKYNVFKIAEKIMFYFKKVTK